MTRLAPLRPDVIDERFGDEVVVVNLRTGRYYSLEGSAAPVWAALAGGATPDEVAAAVGLPAAGLLPFLRELVAEELVGVEGETLPGGGGPLPEGREPRLLVFTDMADILQLDPIHDIDLDGSGWPERPQSAEAA